MNNYIVEHLTIEQSVDALVEIAPARGSAYAGDWLKQRINFECGFNLDDRFAAREYLANHYGYCI